MTHSPALVVDAAVINRKQVGDYVLLELECPALAERAIPGQFVNVRCAGVLLRRPFSIYRPVEERTGARRGVALLFKVIGPGTRFMAERRPGEPLNLLGPLGHGLENPELLGERVLLVAGGYGVAPLDFCARALRAAKRDVRLLLGTNALSLLPLYQGEPLEAWPVAASFQTLGVPLRVASLAGEPGMFHGTVVDLLESVLEGRPDVLGCGSHAMMRATAQACARHGLRCFVLMEELMGCGLSVCRSCVCRVRETGPDGSEVWANRTACVDGPLFDAATIDWEWSMKGGA